MKRLAYFSIVTLVLFLLVIIIACSIWFWQASRPINSLTFDPLNNATKIVVKFPSYGIDDRHNDIEIDVPQKIEFARNFIKKHPDGWQVPFGTPPPATSFYIEFFDDDIYLGAYGVGPVVSEFTSIEDTCFLVYYNRKIVKHIDPQERKLLTDILQIVEVETNRPE